MGSIRAYLKFPKRAIVRPEYRNGSSTHLGYKVDRALRAHPELDYIALRIVCIIKCARQPDRVIERDRLRQSLVQFRLTPEEVIEIIPTERVRDFWISQVKSEFPWTLIVVLLSRRKQVES